MPINWHAEACDLARDPQSGALITRLTASVMTNANLYFEQPHTSPDGKRVAYTRALHADPRRPPMELCVADLETLRIAPIDSDITSSWFATSAWSGKLHYLRSNGELIRVDLSTLEKEIVMTHWPLSLSVTLWSVTPDMRYLIVGRRTEDCHSELLRVDMHTQDWRVLCRSKNILNHVQISHATGRDVLVQVNRRPNPDAPDQPAGATHMLVDINTGSERPLKIGEPFTCGSTGHATWVGDTGRIASPVHWPAMRVDFTGNDNRPPHDPRHPQGNHVIIGPDDDGPTIFNAPKHSFVHASSSKCGRYFVADAVSNGIPGPVEIVVGDYQSGKHRTLVADCGASMGGPACQHVHPFFTADNRNVIYNSDRTGVCHLHTARVPDDFLASLNA